MAPSGVAHTKCADAGALGRAQQAPGGEAVELLERRARLVALGAGEVHDGAHAAQRVAERGRVGEVADGQLHAHALGPEPARVAHQAAHGLAPGHEPAQHGGAEQSGGAGEQEHAGHPSTGSETATSETRAPWPT